MRWLRRIPPESLLYAVLALACWPVPLLQVLHAESMALLAFFAYFIAGTAALRAFGSPASGVLSPASGVLSPELKRERLLTPGSGLPTVPSVLVTQLRWLLVPLGLWTVTLAWAPNCGYMLGLLFFLLFPVVTVVFAVALAWALAAVKRRRKRLWLWVIGLLISVAPVLYDLGLHPQFYTYNHVFGGVLGPIYDEELALRPGLFAFRALTLLWAAFFLCIGNDRKRWVSGVRSPESEEKGTGLQTPDPGLRKWARMGAGLGVCIGVMYLFAAQLGLNTPAWLLQHQLGGHVRTEHFDLYFDPDALDPEEVQRLADDHEFRYAQMAARLDQEIPRRIQSYLYPDADVKARLTGARYTSVAPVWLSSPQTHVLLDRYEATFPHELAHVFSRPHGLPLLNAPLQAGLVEGWAVALEPPDALPAPHAQVAAAATLFADSTLAERLAASLSPQGFWTGRSAVSYTTTGSFVQWLLDAYGADRLKQVYRRADFERVYGQPVDTLAAWWARFIRQQPVTPMAEALVLVRFTRPSLFEKPCPHYVPSHVRRTRRAQHFLSEGDTARALVRLDAALARRPAYEPALMAKARVYLARNAPMEAAHLLQSAAADTLADPALVLLWGDALALTEQRAGAEAAWHEAERRAPRYARDFRVLAQLRPRLSAQALRWWHAPGPPEVRAEQIASDVSVAQVLRALLLAEARPQARALAAMPESLGDPVLDQRLAAWRAHLALRARQYEVAEAAALAARAGADPDEAAYLDDLLAKIRWLRQNRLEE